jgi:serine/threonine-protein kinase HipA
VTPERRSVEVYADWSSLNGEARMGVLHATPVRAKEVFSFEYDRAWLDAGQKHALDPALRLGPGPQFVAAGRENFGVFLDSSPDRWGRVLMQRREAQLAREEGRKERRLLELDYLLGVYDGHRLGALRYRVADGPFLDDNAELASPPWTSLRKLEQASLQLERVDDLDPASAKWLRLLVAPGRSLGGARPKASVLDQHGALWIAKFPSDRDTADIGAWESVVTVLAKRAGVHVGENLRQRFGSRHHTFLSKRFDRSRDRKRIHFCSAMTLLDRSDGEEGASYLDLAQVVIRQGGEPTRDLEQLWRRVVFFICVSNVDDHLRNHGFLLGPQGWALAPAYDLNPVADAAGLTLNISETDNALDLALAREVAQYFRIKSQRANAIVAEVVTAVRDWRTEAKLARLSRTEQDQMAPAFRVAEGAPGR